MGEKETFSAQYCTEDRSVDGTIELLAQSLLFTPDNDADIPVYQCLIQAADIAECASVSTVLEDALDQVEHFLQLELVGRENHDVMFRFASRASANECCRAVLELRHASEETADIAALPHASESRSHVPFFSDFLGLTSPPPGVSPPPLTLNPSDKPATEYGGQFLLTRDWASDIREMLPLEFRFSEFRFLFSPKLHGISVPSFFRRCDEFPYPSVVLVREAGGCCVFGAFCRAAWVPSHRYFGSTETFVFTLQRRAHREVAMYACTGNNRLFQFADEKSIVIGGGSKRSDAALSVHADWLRGTSGSCETFGTTRPLACKSDFVIADIEFWSVLPETVIRPGLPIRKS